ncbi:MAG TPA: phage portal protein [Saprospiraceae bacterium]|nr:phage portal protein [Saprospiraceae bacterium]HMU04847.1 phage portal protein [Saprospiraceae bacterium]
MTKREIISNIFGIDTQPSITSRSSSGNGWFSLFSNNTVNITSPIDGLGISTVYACVDTISRTIATLPTSIRHVNSDGTKVNAVTHPQYDLFTREMDSNVTPYIFKRDMVIDFLLWGNAYSLPIRNNRGQITRYKYIAPWDMMPWRDGNGELWYHCYDKIHQGVYRPSEVIHIRDIGCDDIGYSKIHLHAMTIGKEKAAARFIKKFYENGLFLGGVVEYPESSGNLTAEQVNRLRDSFKDTYGGVDKGGQVGIITGGGQLKQFKNDMPLSNAQYVESSGMNKKEIATIFNVPGPKIGLTEGTPYNSLEALNTDYWQNCILPIVTMIEQEFNLKAFTPGERCYLNHNYDSILLTDTATKGEYFQKMFNIGVLNRNEIRDRMELNAVPYGDEYFIQGNNMITVEKAVNQEPNAAPNNTTL